MALKINHDLKLVFLHIPKTGGMFITLSLLKNYNFEEYDIYENNSNQIVNNKDINNKNINGIKRCTSLIENGYRYLLHEEIMNYKYFCFVRNPYERFISGILYSDIKKDGFSNLYEVIMNMENYKNCMVNTRLNDLEAYLHIFLTQSHFIKNIPNVTILKFENLNNNFCDFLLKNGIKEISHEKTPINISTYEEKHFWEYYDTFVLNFVNNFFDEDFKNFGFEKYDNVLDFYYQMNKKLNPYKEY
jgi:hypothetical protein